MRRASPGRIGEQPRLVRGAATERAARAHRGRGGGGGHWKGKRGEAAGRPIEAPAPCLLSVGLQARGNRAAGGGKGRAWETDAARCAMARELDVGGEACKTVDDACFSQVRTRTRKRPGTNGARARRKLTLAPARAHAGTAASPSGSLDLSCAPARSAPTRACDLAHALVQLRRHFGVPDDFLAGDAFSFKALAPSGGKGGQLIARTACRHFFVKEVCGEDEETIRAADFQAAYVEHMTTRPSFICRFLALFVRAKDGKTYVAMGNCLPADKSAEGEGGWHKVYDLKGTADDKLMVLDGEEVEQVHKRCWNVPWMASEGCMGGCAVDDLRKRYKRGKTTAFNDVHRMSAQQRTRTLGTLQGDATLMRSLELMDYSLIIAVRQTSAARAREDARVPGDGDLHAPPLVVVDGDKATIMYFGVIDFLQRWTSKKRTAHIIKKLFAPKPISTVPPTDYEEQFMGFFTKRFKAVDGLVDGVQTEGGAGGGANAGYANATDVGVGVATEEVFLDAEATFDD